MSRPPLEPAMTLISMVVPVHNEVGSIEPFLARAKPVLDEVIETLHGNVTWEILFVDDGSTDATLDELLAARLADHRVRIVCLSRNFGKDTALAAGLEHSVGQAVIPIDVDLQDPPEVVHQFVAKWLEGFDVVTGVRSDRSSDTWMKRTTAGIFYRVFNKVAERPILPDAGDFRLLSRAVVDVLRQFPERARFMKGLFSWVGFKQTQVDYVRDERAAGTTKWKYWKLWNFAIDGITTSTTVPLRIWTYLGAGAALAAFVYAAALITRTLIYGRDVPGYASIMVAVLFLGGLNLLSVGIIGEYLGRVYTEVKGRPLYIVRETFGVEDPAHPRPAARAPEPIHHERPQLRVMN